MTFPGNNLEHQAASLAREYFGLEASASRLPGELDHNFLLQQQDGARFILKIAHAGEQRAQLELQNAIMQHLERGSVDLSLPRLQHSLQGEGITAIQDEDGNTRFLRLLTWVPGRLFAHVNPHTAPLLESLGEACGKLCTALYDFDHPGAHRWLKWDVAQADWTAAHLDSIPDQERQLLARTYADYFQRHTAPRLGALRRSVIYNDANDYNVLVEERSDFPRIKGVIDFGDAVHTCCVADLAIAIAYAAMNKPRPLDAAVHVVRGFNRFFPLQEAELEVLYGLVAARLLISVTASALNRLEEPDNEYLLISERPAWDLLCKWQELNADFAHYSFRQACGLEPCPKRVRFEQWLASGQSEIGAVVKTNQPPLSLDLSVGSLDLGNNDDFATARRFEQTIDHLLGPGGTGIGGYGEVRPIYSADRFRLEGNDGPLWRTVHLGVDFWSAAGTPVYAPLDGVVHSFEDNAGQGNYGPTIILEHPVTPDLTFFTLYGHLSGASLQGLRPGTPVSKGELVGWIGAAAENGDWPSHLHFQVILDLLGRAGDFQGVALPEEQAVWLSLCPGLNPLQPAPLSPANAAGDAAHILESRRQHLGRSMSISYRRPLHIVRGYRQHLYDDVGRRYLDTVNNVPHVGHQHSRVVRAASRQMAVLNTNTRYLHENIVRFAEELLAMLPEELSVVHFVNSGSEANELALRMARTITGRQDVIAVEMGYHGNTGACVDISSYKFDRKGGSGAPPHTHILPMPDVFRGMYRSEPEAGRKYAAEVAPVLSRLQAAGRGAAAFICESVLSCGGQIVLPAGYLAEVYRQVRAAGGLCIADEVQVGFGRVGTHFWGFELQGVVPDIVTLGKPIGNGHPLGAIVTTAAVADAFANGMEYFNTFGGNPVSCAIGREVLKIIKEEGLQAQAARVGAYLTSALRDLQLDFPIIGDVRGPGLFMGFELVKNRERLEPATQAAAYLANRMRDLGVLMSTDGPYDNVLKIKPPLCFDERDVDFLADMLRRVLAEDAMRAAVDAAPH
jgi:4-aminobutyrate aminotransferase-like enzyme/Ser/Thr protein kinase RdoA (MazF antagonist)